MVDRYAEHLADMQSILRWKRVEESIMMMIAY